MQTKQEMFLDLLGAPDVQFVIPVYQRVYAWSGRQCEQLWADIMRVGEHDAVHFIGTLLYAAEPPSACEAMRLDIIDGQQRAATLSLLLAALCGWLDKRGRRLGGVGPEDIRKRYLQAPSDAQAPKLLLSRIDRATMAAVLASTALPEGDELSANVVGNFEFFRTKMTGDFSPADAELLWRGLNRLLIISAIIDGSDRPQLIFESLNSKGIPLTTADLVRNLMLVNVGYEEQTRLYETYWAPIERLYGDDPGSVRMNAALHGYLAVTAPKLKVAGKDDVYAAFKTYIQELHHGSLEELLIGLKGFCETFAAKSQSAGATQASKHASWGNGKVEGIISEKKLFGD